MARIRSDKPEAYQSETLAEISLAAERTFKGMATIADDRSRLPDKPAQINGELWAMRGNHTREDLEAELSEMTRVGLVCRYVGCDGKRYLHMPTWDRHQKIDRPSKSRLPRCTRHLTEDDECGKHKGDCEPIDAWTFDGPSRESREDSRGLQQAENGLDAVAVPVDAVAVPAGSSIEVEPVPNGTLPDQANGHHPPDQEQQESSRDSREVSRESPPLDLGSRTLDRGSRTLDLKDLGRNDPALFDETTPPEPVERRGRPTKPRPGSPPHFDDWYAAYPVHKAPGDAEKAWRTVMREGADPLVLIDAAKRYRDDPDVRRGYGKHPARWLRAKCWLDETSPAPAQNGNSRQQETDDMFGAAMERARIRDREASS